jgi:hypothetical protein
MLADNKAVHEVFPKRIIRCGRYCAPIKTSISLAVPVSKQSGADHSVPAVGNKIVIGHQHQVSVA